jgi:hypothetical protein
MSVAAAQYAKFREQVAADGKVYTFTEDGEYLVYPVHGREVIPFWSSRSRLEKIQERVPKYQRYDFREMPLPEFLRWLPELGEQNIHIGVNWSGERLTGYDVSVKDLLAALEYEMNRNREK